MLHVSTVCGIINVEVYCGTSGPIVCLIKGVAVTEPETNCTFGGKLTGGTVPAGSVMNPLPVYAFGPYPVEDAS